MKKLILAMIGLAFAFAITSCDDQGKRCREYRNCPEKEDQRPRRW